jgi:tRNA/tmRNA/rRNA uracil-C5-methylase (TrmA/RlmC/RlmD family)
VSLAPSSFSADADLIEGDRVEVVVGAPAHGGHCVARIGGPHGRVVFVRHALPGERVTAEITEIHRGYLRADAVEIHEASPDRVTPPCPHARPGGCGGCDLQHASGEAQLRWKAEVVREQLVRLAGLDPDHLVRVEALPPPLDRPGDDPGQLLGWRSRIRYAIDAAGRPGLLQHRSHQVVPIDRCRIAHPAIQNLDVLANDWPNVDALQAIASTGGDVAVLGRPSGSAGPAVGDDLTEAPEGGALFRLSGPAEVIELAAGRAWRIPPQGFWQVHPSAADTLVNAVLEMLRPAVGETVWDLYGGAGLFAAALAERAGGRVTVVESSPTGVAAARANLAGLIGSDGRPLADIVEARVDVALARRRVAGPVDLVVLDPPRAGAGARVVRSLAAARPRAIAYVACDPAALARDLKTFASLGWRLEKLRAFDCFPMTQHVECVAHLLPTDNG